MSGQVRLVRNVQIGGVKIVEAGAETAGDEDVNDDEAHSEEQTKEPAHSAHGSAKQASSISTDYVFIRFVKDLFRQYFRRLHEIASL